MMGIRALYPDNLWLQNSPLRQWCGWNSTQHQTWRSTVSGDFMACQLTTLSLFNTDLIRYADKVCWFVTIDGLWRRDMPQEVGYEGRVFRWDAGWKVSWCWVEICQQNEGCWVEIRMLGGNTKLLTNNMPYWLQFHLHIKTTRCIRI